MRAIKELFLAKIRLEQNVLGVLAYENPNQITPLLDGFDLMLFIVTANPSRSNSTYHYSKDGCRIQERWIDPKGLESWVLIGENRSIIQWILQGEILLDHNAYLDGIRQRLVEFPYDLRERKLLLEFSRFLRTYLQSKEYAQQGHLLDAYSNVLEALHHWARIVIIEQGIHPEVTVWSQVRKINPGVYKLYEELTLSPETIEQRVQLVLLACEFSVMSKMNKCSSLLIRILDSRLEPWSSMELIEHPELRDLHMDIGLVLKKLIKKSLIKEVAVATEQNLEVLELKYTH